MPMINMLSADRILYFQHSRPSVSCDHCAASVIDLSNEVFCIDVIIVRIFPDVI